MRTFIAIDLADDLKAAVQGLVQRLSATRADIRWVRPPGLHLTLKFLGEIDEGRAIKVKSVLAAVSSRHSPFRLALQGCGAFPNERRPRVLWIGFAPEPRLLALQEDLEGELEKAGFPREERPFRPHLTLGRVRGPAGVDRAVRTLAERSTEAEGVMDVKALTLFESRLHPQGADYISLGEYPLR